MTDNTKMREALLKFGDENPALDLDFRLHTHGKYLTQEKAIVASRAFKAGAAWQAAQPVPVDADKTGICIDGVHMAPVATSITAQELDALRKDAERLQKDVERMQKALSEIAEWTDRYTSPGHPISTIARAAMQERQQ